MPDEKESGSEKARSKFKEGRKGKEKAKGTGGEETMTSSRDVPLRRQVDLFHFYKKRRGQETDVPNAEVSHTTATMVKAGDDLLNHEDDNALHNRDTRNSIKFLTERNLDETNSADETPLDLYLNLKGTKLNNVLSSEPQSDTSANLVVNTDILLDAPSNLRSASDGIITNQSIDSSTDWNLAVQQQPNTSFSPSIIPLTLIPASADQSIPTRCAALPPSPFPLSFSTHQILQFPSQPDGLSSGLPSRPPLFLTSCFVSDQERGDDVIGGIVEESENINNIQGNMTENCLSPSEQHGAGGKPEEDLLPSPTATHYPPVQPFFALSSASTELRLNNGEISEHGNEKGSRRCGDLDEEASVSIHNTSKKTNTNMPVIESINAINLPVFAPNRLVAEDAEDPISPDKLHFPHVIDLTDSPESKLGPPTYPLSIRHKPIPRIVFSQGTSIEQNTTSADRIGNSSRSAFSPPPGSQDKPIELFSPLKSAIKSTPASASRPQSPPSKTASRELRRKHVKIHPFFQRTASNALTATNVSGDADEDVNDLNFGFGSVSSPDTNTNGPSKIRTEKGKRNKDKLGDEERCDNDEGDEEADIILSQYAGEKAPFRDLTFRLADSTSALRSNSIAAGATYLPQRSVLSKAQILQVRWPNDENQHVMKSDRLKEKGRSPFSKRIKSTGTSNDKKAETTVSLAKQLGLKDERRIALDPTFRTSFCYRTESSNPTIQNAIESIPNEHREHPRISRILSLIEQKNGKGPGRTEDADAEMPLNHSMWNTKWRPRHAVEVLGNESQAMYLREWLKSLAIRDQERPAAVLEEDEGKEGTQKRNRSKKKKEQGVKRRIVIRSISKRKRRRIGSEDDEDDDMSWIVDDDGEEDEDEVVGKDEGDWTPNEGKSQGSDHNNNPYKGDFTKRLTNTILLAGASGTGKTSAVYACAEELGWEVFEVNPGVGKRTGLNIVGLIGDVGKNHIVGKGARQSIILLEEVDILFKEDTNFWTSVVNIISTSHRPVIMTCNDASLVPQKDLPLQRCLNFEACPCGLAVSFLQVVCIAEERDMTRERVAEEYTLLGGDEPEWPPSIAFPSQALPSADLRKALNRLQLGLRFSDSQQGYSGDWRECKDFGEYTLDDCELHTESVSYFNAYIDRTEERPGFETQGDDEIGYTMLTNPDKSECSGMGINELNEYSYNYSMACDALACCRHVGDGIPFTNWTGSQTLSDSRHRWLIQTRRHLTRQAASFLDELISLPGPLLPRSEAILEYIPVVRWLVALDDVRDVPSDSSARRRWRHVRYLDLSEEALGAVREYYEMFFPRRIT